MYSVSTLSLQNIYAPSAKTKKTSNTAVDAVFAPSAAEKYAQADSTAVTADNFYDILAERAKTSAEKIVGYDSVERIDNDTMAERIIDNLTAAGILKSEDDEEEEVDEAADELLKAIKARQKALKEESIDRKKSGFTVEEIKEVLAGLHCVNSMTVK